MPFTIHRRSLLAVLPAVPAALASAASPPTAVEDAPRQAQGPLATVHPSLHLVGDSTMADKRLHPPQPERGWGQALRDRMREPQRLVNHAVNGRSGKSFRAEGRWDHVLAQLAPGDFVLSEVAADLQVPLLDLHRDTQQWLERLGPEASKQMFMWIAPGTYATLPEGRQDDTHFVELGATAVADQAIGLLRKLNHPLSAWFKDPANH